MNETMVYADSFFEEFAGERDFLDFLEDRKGKTTWKKELSNTLRFEALVRDTPKTEAIVNSYDSIVSYLSPYGITLNKAVRIHERFGDKSMEVLNERPFELCDIAGFGFKTVDAIAKKIKCKPNDKMRIKAAAKYIMTVYPYYNKLHRLYRNY